MLRHLLLSTGKGLIRNHRQFRVNVSYCEDFLNLQDRRRPLGCLVTILTVIISAIRVTVASPHELIIKPITGWFILIDDRLNNQTDFHH